MKKTAKIILIAILALVVVFASFACSERPVGNHENYKTDEEKKADENKNNRVYDFQDTTTVDVADDIQAIADRDQALLERHGFTVIPSDMPMTLRTSEEKIKADNKDLVYFINAIKYENDTSTTIFIYYFAEESKAQKCYYDNWKNEENYFLVDYRLIQDFSKENLFNLA